MDRDTRNAIERAAQQARKLLEDDFSSQLQGTFDILRTGVVTGAGGAHLSARQVSQREKIVAAIAHKRATGMTAAGAVADYHGGPTLQELVIPVITVRLKVHDSARLKADPITASGLPEAVTNRIFSVTLQLGGQNLSLFSSAMVVRPLLMSSGKQVGAAGMAIDAELDRSTGCVKLQPGKPVTVAFLLTDDSVPSLRVVVQDPATDAELFRSPTDIPVRLGV